LRTILTVLPDKISESKKFKVGSLSFELQEGARATGNPELAKLIGGLSTEAMKTLLRSSKNRFQLLVSYIPEHGSPEYFLPDRHTEETLLELERARLLKFDEVLGERDYALALAHTAPDEALRRLRPIAGYGGLTRRFSLSVTDEMPPNLLKGSKTMAKLVCTLQYSKIARKVIATYHIELEKSDRFEINTTTEDIALKVEEGNPAAKKLVKRLKTQRSAKTVQAQRAAREPSDVYIPDHSVKSTGPNVPMTQFTASFATADVAKFTTGFYEADAKSGENEFEPYDGGLGLSLPLIP
jgi:hypothetical protein